MSLRKWFTGRSALLLVVALIAIAIDQVSKNAALKFLPSHQRVPALGDLLGWYLTFNDSAAFSLGFGITWIFTLISFAAAIAIIWFAPRVETGGWAVLGGVLLGGVIGNLIDRLTREPGFPNGHVIDFIQIPFNFPIFNIADCCISVSMAFIALRLVKGEQLGKASKTSSEISHE